MCGRNPERQQILLGYYPIMAEYRKNHVKAGLTTWGISMDRCLAGQIIDLWEAGIRTYGCCCGHGKYKGWINTGPEDFEKAIALGYKHYIYENAPDRKDTVFAKNPYPCDYDI